MHSAGAYEGQFWIWWSIFLLNFHYKYLTSAATMPQRKILPHYKHMSEFERGLRSNWKRLVKRIPRHLDRCGDYAMMSRVGQQRQISKQNDSCRPRTSVELEDIAVVRAVITAPYSSLSAIHHVVYTYVFNMTLGKWLKEWYLYSHRQLWSLSDAYTPSGPIRVVLCPIKDELHWLWRIVFSDEFLF